MNFELSDEARMLQDGLRRYLADAYARPLREPSDTVWAGLAEMGVIGALFPEEAGGFGGTGWDIALVFEELGRVGSPEPLLDTGVLSGGLVAAAGGDVEAVIAGGTRLAFAHGEPGGRYDPTRVDTRVEDGRLTGRKAVVAHATSADELLVSAREGEALTLWRVDPDAVEMHDYPMTGGGFAADIVLNDTPGERLGEGDATEAIVQAQARATLALCAEALGLMERIRALTTDYLKTRKQFGRPIGTFQVLQHRMADLLIEIEQARSAVVNLAGNVDGPDRDRHVAATKNLIGEVARLVAEEAIQMHGGIGMTDEYELSHLVRRLTMVDHRFGDTLYHLERFIRLAVA
ncbi:acyl-CoA dehydrogenase family protein [Jannaschia aquimarina]|uniref:AcrC_1 protein n=1 Tax=Jannaschia aquimarina TaxID=935700 RepID=A0A0D1CSX9_9RHOB|nr:acyl-CoA dehydrogenase [Jannaschia aquimarina]KIT17862.1 Acryloyl-CoA reductase (NADH) [Jannaschia aquimarina]SNS56172.1 Acyl-CoA dehydrogenase [Jannaschia aquimarina]